jgi:hypothetical protein
LQGSKREFQYYIVIQKHIRESPTWSLSRETTEEDVQVLIVGNSPIVATYRKDEPGWNGDVAWTAEAVWNGEAVWSGEGHFMFDLIV